MRRTLVQMLRAVDGTMLTSICTATISSGPAGPTDVNNGGTAPQIHDHDVGSHRYPQRAHGATRVLRILAPGRPTLSSGTFSVARMQTAVIEPKSVAVAACAMCD
jgi:hypothetical protein